MTMAVAATLGISLAAGCRWIWVRWKSGPGLRVAGRTTGIPSQFRIPARHAAPGTGRLRSHRPERRRKRRGHRRMGFCRA